MNHQEAISPVEVDAQKKPQKEQWGAGQAIFVTISLFVVSQVFASFVMGLIGYSMGHKDVGEWLTDSVSAQFGFYVIAEGLVLAILWLLVRRYQKPLEQLGFKRKPLPKDAGYVLRGYAMYFIAFIIISTIAQRIAPSLDTDQKQEIGFATAKGFSLIFVFLSLVVLPPVTEEILFRGYLYRGLRRALPISMAAILTSVLFGVAHLQFGNDKPLLWVAALDTFSLSLVLIWLREKTGNLWAPIGLHMLKNGIAFSILFIFPEFLEGRFY